MRRPGSSVIVRLVDTVHDRAFEIQATYVEDGVYILEFDSEDPVGEDDGYYSKQVFSS